MTQSSVEWFYQQIRDNGAGFTQEDLMEWHMQAKAMNEQEMIDFHNWCVGYKSNYPYQNWTTDFLLKRYKQTFKSE